MALTVPQAGVQAGRAARVGEADVPETGAAFAQLGQVMQQVGTRLETDRLDRQAARLRIDLTRDMGELRQRIETITDPDEVDRQWQAGVDALRASYDERVDAKLRDRWSLTFDEAATASGLQIGRHGIAMRESTSQAQWIEASTTVGNLWGRSTEEERGVMVQGLVDQIEADLRNGYITPAQAAERQAALRGQLVEADALAMVDRDPAAFLEARQQGRFDGLDPVQLERYGNRAQANLDRLAAETARAEAEAEKARLKAVGDRLDTILSITGDGYTAADEDFVFSAEAQGHPDQPKAAAAVALRRDYPALEQMSPTELRATLAEEKGKPLEQAFQTERLQVLETMVAEAEKAWAEDPIARAVSVGLPVADLPPFDASNPAALVAGLRDRLDMADARQREGYTKVPVRLSQDEADALKAQLAAEADPRARLALTGSVVAAAGGDPRRAVSLLQEATDDPVVTFGAQHLADGGSAALLREIYQGQSELAAGNIQLPPNRDRLDAAFEEVQSVFADLPNAAAAEAQIRTVADALYAARARTATGGPAEDIEEDVYRQALHEVMGGTGRYNRAEATGGVQDVNGDPVYLVRGVSAVDVETAFDRLSRRDVLGGSTRGQGAQDRMDDTAVGERLQSILSSASGQGFPVHADGTPLAADELEDFGLRAIGNDRYVLVYRGDTPMIPRDSATGGTFTFSLRQLLQEVPE